MIRNAADATLRGVELEVTAVPIEGLTLRGSWSWLESEYDEFQTQANDGTPIDLSDNDFAYAPDWKYALGATYTFPEFGFGSLILSADYSHRDRQPIGIETKNPIRKNATRQGNYGLLGARATLVLPDEKTEISLWGTNLLDREYFYSARDLVGAGFGTIGRTWGPPRMYGLQVRRYFGEGV